MSAKIRSNDDMTQLAIYFIPKRYPICLIDVPNNIWFADFTDKLSISKHVTIPKQLATKFADLFQWQFNIFHPVTPNQVKFS